MTCWVRVDIVSDPVCPWCYIGWSRLKAAAATLEDVALEVHWLPFELNPQMPEEGMERASYLRAKFGDGRVEEIYARVRAAAAADGLPLELERIQRSPSTLKAHRLLLLAEEAGSGPGDGPSPATLLKERLFQDYFVDGRDIGDAAVLTAAAARAGLPRGRIEEFLASDVGTEDVRALEGEAQRLGVQGVPFFLLDRRLAISGAQSPEVLAGAIREAIALRDGEAPVPSGEAESGRTG
jgi:predicted DsbA family dithiol-disulfide isomerase